MSEQSNDRRHGLTALGLAGLLAIAGASLGCNGETNGADDAETNAADTTQVDDGEDEADADVDADAADD